MTRDQEVSFLRGVLKHLDEPRAPTKLGLVAEIAIWLAAVVAGIVVLQVFGVPSQAQTIAAIVGLVVGALGMFIITTNVFGRHILAACRVADRELIEARLRELLA